MKCCVMRRRLRILAGLDKGKNIRYNANQWQRRKKVRENGRHREPADGASRGGSFPEIHSRAVELKKRHNVGVRLARVRPLQRLGKFDFTCEAATVR